MDAKRNPKEPASERFDAVLGVRRGSGELRETVRRVGPGDRLTLVLPFSEACIHLRLAGKSGVVEVVGTGRRVAARILDAEGRIVAGQLLPEEVGLRRDDLGYYVLLD